MKSISRFIVSILTTCLLINLFAVNKINAQSVDTDLAKLVAKNFFADRLSRSKVGVTKGISSQNLDMLLVYEENGNAGKQNEEKKGEQTLPLYYVFNVKDKTNPKDKNGFIIVSADQKIPAVLGYSFNEEFSEIDQAPAFKAWMDHYKDQIIYVIQNNLTTDPEISDNWKKYSGTIELKGTEQLSEVTPMLTTKWSQRSYCNNLCPGDADITCGGSLNYHVPAGCAAVAMAQIMKYWNYPVANNPIPGYDDPLSTYNFPASPLNGTSISYGWIPAISVTNYDWEHMPNNILKGLYPDPPLSEDMVGINAVSTLIYHCGVAVQMDYGPSGSGAGSPFGSSIENAFRDYFKYSPDIHKVFKSDYSDDDWAQLLRTELNNNRPVYYSGYANDNYDDGHAFVCDGYQDVEPYFYFCWGEGGGGGNGYFYLNDLTPGNSNYTYKQWAVIDISPNPVSTITDADGNQYNVVKIGTQSWMAENLKTTHFNNGDNITNITSSGTWRNPPVPYYGYCWYNNNDANKDIYGALYNWQAVNTKALCPAGWHVPTLDEWGVLVNYLGIEPGRKLKTGRFGALLGGGRNPVDGTFELIGQGGAWWSSTAFSGPDAWGLYVTLGSSDANLAHADKNTGASVRCIKNAIVWHLKVGEAATYGNISSAGEENWYKFQTGLAGTYVIQTSGSTDTHMYLYNSDQTTMIAEDNDGAKSGHNSKIVWSLGANTWYYVKINGYDNSVTGSYYISINIAPDSPIANNVTATYDGTSHSAGAAVPTGISIKWYDAAIEGNETTQPVGINYGSYSAYAEAVDDVTGCTSALRTKVTLTINKCLATWTTNASHKTYSDSDPSPLTTGSGSNFVEADGITATYSRLSGETVGDYHITATLIPDEALNNYTITNTGADFTIDKKVASVSPNAASKYCGQTDPVFTGTLTGFLSSDEVSVTYSRTAGETVDGSPYMINATLSPVSVLDNYNIAYNTANFIIIGVSIDASQSSKPVPVDSPGITLSAKVSDASSNPVPGVKVWFSVKNGNNLITNYPAVFTDGSGIATLTLNELTSEVDVFKVTAVAGQGCGFAATSIAYLAVYDPNGGFVTGGGWINSPAGAYRADPALTGKANFGFVSKYKKGSNIPDGNTEFQFHEGNLNFSSSSYDLGSLVIAGYKAIYKGAGTINGAGNYKFMVSAVDGNVTGGGGYDKFRIKIWNKSDGVIVYDNNLGKDENDEPSTTLGGGSIVIHKADNNPKKSVLMSEFVLNVYPNPFTDHIYFDLQLMTDSKVCLEIYNMYGSKIATVYDDIVVGYENYRFEYVPKNLSSGIIIYRFIVNGQLMFKGELIHN